MGNPEHVAVVLKGEVAIGAWGRKHRYEDLNLHGPKPGRPKLVRSKFTRSKLAKAKISTT